MALFIDLSQAMSATKIKTNPMHFLNSTSLSIYHPAIALLASAQKDSLELNAKKDKLRSD